MLKRLRTTFSLVAVATCPAMCDFSDIPASEVESDHATWVPCDLTDKEGKDAAPPKDANPTTSSSNSTSTTPADLTTSSASSKEKQNDVMSDSSKKNQDEEDSPFELVSETKDDEETEDQKDGTPHEDEPDFDEAVEVVIPTEDERGSGLNNMTGISKALAAIEASEEENSLVVPTTVSPGSNSLTSTPTLDSVTTSCKSSGTLRPKPPSCPPPGHAPKKIPTAAVPKRSFLSLKASHESESEAMQPPPVPAPLTTAKAKRRSKSLRKGDASNRGRSGAPERKVQEDNDEQKDRSRSARVDKKKPRTPVMVSGTTLQRKVTILPMPISEKEKFLRETAASYLSQYGSESAASYNLHIGLYYYSASDKWPVTSPDQLSSLVLCQDSSVEERWWCYRCDLNKHSGGKRIHSTWPTPEAQCYHYWGDHATADEWKWIDEAKRLKVDVKDLAWHILWIDLDKTPLPSSAKALPLLPLKIPSLDEDRAHNPRVFEAPLKRVQTPAFHASEKRMKKEREQWQIKVAEPEIHEEKREETKEFTALGWESPLSLFYPLVENEVLEFIHPCTSVREYSRCRFLFHDSNHARRTGFMNFLLVVEEHCFHLIVLKLMVSKVLSNGSSYSGPLREKVLALNTVCPSGLAKHMDESLKTFRWPVEMNAYVNSVLNYAKTICQLEVPVEVVGIPIPPKARPVPVKPEDLTDANAWSLDKLD